jgi:cell division protein DivIC
MAVKKSKRKNTGYILFAVVCCLLSVLLVTNLVTNIQRVKQQQATYVALQIQAKALKKERDSLEKEVKNLADDDYVVKYARDHYIFTKGSEKAVVLPDENE